MTVDTIRATKRQQIINFFTDNIGREFDTTSLHLRFGPAFRSRVSEINRDPSAPVTIRNRTEAKRTHEHSVYWGEQR